MISPPGRVVNGVVTGVTGVTGVVTGVTGVTGVVTGVTGVVTGGVVTGGVGGGVAASTRNGSQRLVEVAYVAFPL
jgi:hypothetical protein